jgi:hypothetical protein
VDNPIPRGGRRPPRHIRRIGLDVIDDLGQQQSITPHRATATRPAQHRISRWTESFDNSSTSRPKISAGSSARSKRAKPKRASGVSTKSRSTSLSGLAPPRAIDPKNRELGHAIAPTHPSDTSRIDGLPVDRQIRVLGHDPILAIPKPQRHDSTGHHATSPTSWQATNGAHTTEHQLLVRSNHPVSIHPLEWSRGVGPSPIRFRASSVLAPGVAPTRVGSVVCRVAGGEYGLGDVGDGVELLVGEVGRGQDSEDLNRYVRRQDLPNNRVGTDSPAYTKNPILRTTARERRRWWLGDTDCGP